MLLGTDKPQLSLDEEEDEGLNDDDDIEDLVSLGGAWSQGKPCILSCFRSDTPSEAAQIRGGLGFESGPPGHSLNSPPCSGAVLLL